MRKSHPCGIIVAKPYSLQISCTTQGQTFSSRFNISEARQGFLVFTNTLGKPPRRPLGTRLETRVCDFQTRPLNQSLYMSITLLEMIEKKTHAFCANVQVSDQFEAENASGFHLSGISSQPTVPTAYIALQCVGGKGATTPRLEVVCPMCQSISSFCVVRSKSASSRLQFNAFRCGKTNCYSDTPK